MLNIPDNTFPRIVIIGAGFAGLNLAKKICKKDFQVVILDKNNYHQFQPLFYQVAMAGLEPSSIIFPLRKIFQHKKNVHIRIAEVQSIDHENKRVYTDGGDIYYDKLIIATGARTNYFGNKTLEENTLGLKSLNQSLILRNAILTDLEKALMTQDYDERQGFIDIVIVGGGPTGVELAGALAEMKKYILPKDYGELDKKEVDIYLVQSGSQLLPGMSEKAGKAAEKFLDKLGVHVLLGKRVSDYQDGYVITKDGEKIRANKVIWAAGVRGNIIEGLPEASCIKSSRFWVDEYNQVLHTKDIYAIGDIACMKSEETPYGHPQVAQVAIQQGSHLAKNLIKKQAQPFKYKDYGTMATIGRNKAVVDLKNFKMQGFFAWILWLIVHLRSLIGFKNKIIVLLNWMWNYVTYDQSLRVIIKPEEEQSKEQA